jgi:hypothetical protein
MSKEKEAIEAKNTAIDTARLLGDRPEINVGEICFAW